MQGGGSEDDPLQGVSPSSTIRDLEAACGPLSAASGLLEVTSLPPAKDVAIFPMLWARLLSSLLHLSKPSSCCNFIDGPLKTPLQLSAMSYLHMIHSGSVQPTSRHYSSRTCLRFELGQVYTATWPAMLFHVVQTRLACRQDMQQSCTGSSAP